MNIRDKIPSVNQYIHEDQEFYGPDSQSHRGLIVPEIILEYGSLKAKMLNFSSIAPVLIRCIREMKHSYRSLVNQPAHSRLEISEEDLTDLRDFALSIGIDKLGFTPVRSSFIFSDKKILFNQAIVLLMEMKKSEIQKAPSRKAMHEIFRTYYGLGKAANQITGFLKERGYKAQAGPALGGEVNYPLLAEDAGLGKIGKHGLLITPEFGPSIRIAAVYTELSNLPEGDNESQLWIEDFCRKCMICVNSCPSGAIYREPRVFKDRTEQHIDFQKCAVPFSNNHACTVCIRDCLFFKTGYQKIEKSFRKAQAT